MYIWHEEVEAMSNVKATGFASPAQGYEQSTIDFNQILIKRPASTYEFSIETNNMREFGIFNGSIVVVDRSIHPKEGDNAIIKHDGEFLCRHLIKRNGRIVFTDDRGEIIEPIEGETIIIGKITASIILYDNFN